MFYMSTLLTNRFPDNFHINFLKGVLSFLILITFFACLSRCDFRVWTQFGLAFNSSSSSTTTTLVVKFLLLSLFILIFWHWLGVECYFAGLRKKIPVFEFYLELLDFFHYKVAYKSSFSSQKLCRHQRCDVKDLQWKELCPQFISRKKFISS